MSLPARHYKPSGVTVEQKGRDAVRDLVEHDQKARETELALRAYIAELERDVHRLEGELALALGRKGATMATTCYKNPRTATVALPIRLGKWRPGKGRKP